MIDRHTSTKYQFIELYLFLCFSFSVVGDYKIINVEDIMKEIERVQSYYDAHKITLDKINRYRETFREFVQVEVGRSDV